MILLVLAAGCLASVPLTGGRLTRLAELELRGAWVAVLALALQVVIVDVAPNGDRPLHVAAHLATYGLGGVFMLANRRLPGLALIATGAVSNTLAIVANAGTMPAGATAQRVAGLVTGTGFQNSDHLAHPHLLWLGDIIPVPGPSPLGNVLSIGDCVIFVGFLVLLHRTCRGELQALVDPERPVERHAVAREQLLPEPRDRRESVRG